MSERQQLNPRRTAVTFQFEHEFEHGAPFKYKCTVGYFVNNTIGEVFLNSVKHNTGMDALVQDGGVFISIALQYGVPLSVLLGAIRRDPTGYPASPLGMALQEIMRQQLDSIGRKRERQNERDS